MVCSLVYLHTQMVPFKITIAAILFSNETLQRERRMDELKTEIESITKEGNDKTYLKFVSHEKKEKRTTNSFQINSLYNNQIGLEGCKAISAALQSVNCKLTSLR